MSGSFFYKGIDLGTMCVAGGSSAASITSSKYSGGGNLLTTSLNWKKPDANTGYAGGFKISGNTSAFSSLQGIQHAIGDNTTLSIPSWADSFKFHMRTAKGNAGAYGGYSRGYIHQCWQSHRAQEHWGGAGGAGGNGLDTYGETAVSLAGYAGGALVTSQSGTTRSLTIRNSSGWLGSKISVSKGNNGANGNGSVKKWNAQHGGHGHPGAAGNAGTVNVNNFTGHVSQVQQGATSNSNTVHFFKV
jgi:hypothetical protein